MAKNNAHKDNTGNIWFGFVAGVVLGGGGLYLIGTKDGRSRLKKIIQMAEDMELSVEDVIEEIEEVFEDENPIMMIKGAEKGHVSENLHSVLDKIKQVFPLENQVRRYFAKEGRLQKGS